MSNPSHQSDMETIEYAARDEAKLADALTEAITLAERLLEAKHAMVMQSWQFGHDAANRMSATLRALLTAREEFAAFAQGAYHLRDEVHLVHGGTQKTSEDVEFPVLTRVRREGAPDATR